MTSDFCIQIFEISCRVVPFSYQCYRPPKRTKNSIFGSGLNPFPATGESIFRVWPSPLSVLARNPIKFGHFQPFLCGFFDCIPENRDPTVPHLARNPRFARAAP